MPSTFELTGVITSSQKALVRGWWKKVTATYPKAESFKDMKVPRIEKGVFGVALSQSLDYAHSGISYLDDNTGSECYGIVPTIVAKCGSYLKEEGLMAEGIFRLPGSVKRLRLLQAHFDTPSTYGSHLDWRGYTVHDAASILRRFINYLPEPVITLSFYQPFKDTMDQTFPSVNEKVKAFQALIEQLPLSHQYLLLYLLDLLAIFVTTARFTKMDVDCLAAVFAPGILAHPDDKLNPSSYKHSQTVIRFLIDNQDMLTMPRSQAGLRTLTTQPATTTTFPPNYLTRQQSFTASSPNHRFGYNKNDYQGPSLCSLAPRLMSPVKNESSVLTTTHPKRLGRSRTLPIKQGAFGDRKSLKVALVNRNASQKWGLQDGNHEG